MMERLPRVPGQWLVGQLLFVERHSDVTFLDVVALESFPADAPSIEPGSPVSVGLRADIPLAVEIAQQLQRWASEGRVLELAIMRTENRMGLVLESGSERVVIEVQAA